MLCIFVVLSCTRLNYVVLYVFVVLSCVILNYVFVVLSCVILNCVVLCELFECCGGNNARAAELEAGSGAAAIEIVFTVVPWPRR